MKKMVLGVSMILIALGFCMSPAMAAGRPQGAPTLSSFLASLAAPAPVPAAKRPSTGIQGKALCTASVNCASGTISCESNSSTTSCSSADPNCPGEQGHVTCDGVTTWCPDACPPGCGDNFCNGEDACSSECYPCPYIYNCNYTYCFDSCRCDFRHCAQ
jgi:hypothetical protein